MIEEEKLGPRRIHFPAAVSLGVISIRDWGAPGYAGWKILGEARGSLAIPGGKEVMLKLHWSASNDLRALAPLNHDDIQWLDCRDSQITDAQTLHLNRLTSLHDLGLGHTAIGDPTLRTIERFSTLRELYVPGTKITDAGLTSLGGLDTLRALAINDTGVTNKGLAHLTKLTRLRRLWIKGTAVTDAGIEHLAKLETLARIDIRGTAITETGLAALSRALPKCYIVR